MTSSRASLQLPLAVQLQAATPLQARGRGSFGKHQRCRWTAHLGVSRPSGSLARLAGGIEASLAMEQHLATVQALYNQCVANVDKGSLLVRDGYTHFPQKQREWRFFNGALDIPPAFAVTDGSGDITMDAIDWLARHRVPLIRIRWDGQFSSIVTSGGQAASPSKVSWQQKTRENPRARLAFATDLIFQKARNTLGTLDEYLPRSPHWDKACKNIAIRAELLKRKPPRTFAHLLGIEGSIAGDYFRVWSGLSIKWKALKRYPIPSDWSGYRSRVALRHGIRLRNDGGGYNRGATHPVNAMLNYAYAVLIAQTQIRLIVEGYDPTIGIMHEKKALRGINPGFALDHMEPMRPVVDRAVLQLIDAVTFTGADFSIQHDGVCRMNPELARRVAQLALERCST